jgi:hypothetical protein
MQRSVFGSAASTVARITFLHCATAMKRRSFTTWQLVISLRGETAMAEPWDTGRFH